MVGASTQQRQKVLAVVIVTLLVATSVWLAMAGRGPLHAQEPEDGRCFPETGFCIRGVIRDEWERSGGAVVFGLGLPTSEQREELVEGTPYQVQWFERGRLEIHPELAPPYRVLVSRLGAYAVWAAQEAGRWTPPPRETPTDGCLYFAETGWNVCGVLLDVYRSRGLERDGQPGLSLAEQLALSGLPLTPRLTVEVEGAAYQVQWFERVALAVPAGSTSPQDAIVGVLSEAFLGAPPAPPPALPVATDGAIPRVAASPRAPAATPDTVPDRDAEAWYRQGYEHYNQGNYQQAIAAFSQAIVLNPAMTEAYNDRGLAYRSIGDDTRALADFSQAIEIDPAFFYAYANRGDIFYDQGNYRRAIADYQTVADLRPDLPWAHNDLGLACYSDGDYVRAIASYSQAIAIDPAYAYAYNNRGIVYDERGEHARAIADYDQAIALNPAYAHAYNNRGIAYAHLGEGDRAIADYTRAIELDPAYATAYRNRGDVFFDRGEDDRAIADYTRAIELSPDQASTYFVRGWAFSRRGDRDRAIADFRKVLELSSDPELRQSAQEMLDELLGP
ncbi:MAG: tetratricopeptide repeat protein [Chloroflexaceae bacterium]|nr:tetratricopeptide repeat protein [Chloroflexaceae bacterium]